MIRKPIRSPVSIAALATLLITVAIVPTAFMDTFRSSGVSTATTEPWLVQAISDCESDSAKMNAIEAAVTSALAKQPIMPNGDNQVWRLHSICLEGDWAYGYVTGYLRDTLQPLPSEAEVVLAHLTDTGWQVLFPDMGQAYDQGLQVIPETLVPDSAKALLAQPVIATNLRFTEYALPWPSGESAYVIWHWYTALDFSIGQANGNIGTIRNAKGGTVVFVKDSSTRECGNPPPDWYCWLWANVVVIQSAPNEFAWYLHLAADSVPDWIVEGVYVPAGVDIGREGATGWATTPHLHFQVASWYGCCSGEGDSLLPHWPMGSMQRVNFIEYNWERLPWLATSQNASPSEPTEPGSPPSEPEPPLPPPPPPEPMAALPLEPDSSSTQAQEVVSSAPVCPNPYLVKRGEWLLKIAEQCGVSLSEIVAANPGIRPHLIYAGQALNMPGGTLAVNQGSSQATPAPTVTVTETQTVPVAAAESGNCSGTHVVLRGENLFRIAFNCGLTTAQMASLNGIRSPYTVYTGQVLRFP